jgi:predicted negative regulator of RcsB-dependent stress response
VIVVDENLTDQQQADVVKQWLRVNGSYILGGLALGLGGLFAMNQWQDYRTTQSQQASTLYENIIGFIQSDRTTRANELMMDLETAYSSSPYLDQARLAMAKSHLVRNEFDAAADYLRQVVDDSGSVEMAHIARLRLARVRLHQQQYEVALKVLDEGDANSAFAPRFHEVRGDVYAAMDDAAAARAEYEAAMAASPAQPVIDRVYVQAKLDALGGGDAVLAVTDAIEPGLVESAIVEAETTE